LEALRGSSVLTVGEAEGFARRGGAIELRKEGDEIHFEINVDAAERAELQVSAQLLKLAVNVIGSQSER